MSSAEAPAAVPLLQSGRTVAVAPSLSTSTRAPPLHDDHSFSSSGRRHAAAGLSARLVPFFGKLL